MVVLDFSVIIISDSDLFSCKERCNIQLSVSTRQLMRATTSWLSNVLQAFLLVVNAVLSF